MQILNYHLRLISQPNISWFRTVTMIKWQNTMNLEENWTPVYCWIDSVDFFLTVKSPIQPSIHFLYQLNSSQGHRWFGAYPSCHQAKYWVNPGWVGSPSQDKHTETTMYTHSIQGSIWNHQLPYMHVFGPCQRKSEYLERTHARTGRALKLNSKFSHIITSSKFE